MGEIYELTGEDLIILRRSLVGDTTRVSVMIDGGLKIKVGESVWSLPLGELSGTASTDPVSDTAKATARQTARALDTLATDLRARASDLRDMADGASQLPA
jgi:hypothetical protein